MATRMCDVCGVRPAVMTVRRTVPGGPSRIEHLCEVHAAEARGGPSAFAGSPMGGGSLFDEFFGRFFDEGQQRTTPGRASVLRRRAEQVDITRYFSDATTELLQLAARLATEQGSPDLTDEHLLLAALEDGTVRRALEAADADPDQIRAQLEQEAEKGGRTDVAPSLASGAKRALLAAYEESRALGASYIGPEHVLLALTEDEESEAARLLSRFGLLHTKLRGAVVRGGTPLAARRASQRAPRPPSTSIAATSPGWPVRAGSTPSSAVPRRSRRPSRSWRAGPKTTPCS